MIQSVSDSSWCSGKIVSVNMENFLTYKKCSIPNVHEDLNLVIGPNGTGKSSIVCAICLGLNGKPTILGRSKEERDFIRHGKERAEIELEIFNSNGAPFLIKRIINRNGNPKNKWFLNGRVCKAEDIEDLKKKLKIQIDNLCQFLPQDRVQAFSGMIEIERLSDSISSIDPNLSEKHKKLTTLIAEGQKLANDKRKIDELIDEQNQIIQRLQPSIDLLNSKATSERRIKLLSQRRLFLIHEEEKEKYQQLDEKRKTLKKELEAHQESVKPLEEEIRKARAQILKLREQTIKASNHCESLVMFGKDQQQRLENCTNSQVVVSEEFKRKEREEKQRKETIQRLEAEINQYTQILDSLPSKEEILTQLSEKNGFLSDIRSQESVLETRKSEALSGKDLSESEISGLRRTRDKLEDKAAARRNCLQTTNPDAYRAVEWVEANESLFKNEFSYPMLLKLNIKEDNKRRHIENHIAKRDLTAFVFTDKDDLNTFSSEMQDKMKNKTACLLAPPESESSKFQLLDDEKLKYYGFQGVLEDYIEAPGPIMRLLQQVYHIHRTPVGSESLLEKIDEIGDKFPVFYTDGRKVTIKKSKYSGNVSVSESALRDASLLKDSVDLQQKAILTQQIEDKQKELGKFIDDLKGLKTESDRFIVQRSKLNEEILQLKKHTQKQSNLEVQISHKTRELEQRKKYNVDLKSSMQKTLEAFLDKQNKKNELYKNALSKFDDVFIDVEKHSDAVYQVTLQTHSVKLNEQQKKFEAEKNVATQKELERINEIVDTKKQEVRGLWVDALKECGLSMDVRRVPDELTEEFNSANVPDNLVALEVDLEDEREKHSSIDDVSPSIQRKYNEHQRQLSELVHQQESGADMHHSHQRKIEKIKFEWLTRVREVVKKIDENFSRFMSELKCTGQVSLTYPNEEEYDKYGISIKVSYRANDAATELKRNYQSGGEKSVATMLYLLALQELNTVPFRIVDEINQGMDSENERKVFNMVVESVTTLRRAQYFIVTPKLLPNLNYKPNMRTLIVFNGSQCAISSEDWKVSRFIRRHRRMVEAEASENGASTGVVNQGVIRVE